MSTSERIKDPDAGPAAWQTPPAAFWTETRGGSLVLRLIRSITAHPGVVLVALVLAAGALNFWETRGQTLLSDEWARFYFPHTDFESLLRWRTGHLVVLQVGLYKGVFGVFGADSYLPFRVIEAFLIGSSGLLFYALARCRVGPWPSLLATAVLLFLGSAWEVTATPYGIVILLPVVFGLAALVCLERWPGRGDLLACLLLIASLASQSDGLAFLVASAVLLVVQSGRPFLARSWVVLIPGLLYGAWSVWYRLTQDIPNSEQIYLHNLSEVPSTVLGAAAAGLSAISGFFGTSGPNINEFDLSAGYFLLAVIVLVVLWWASTGWAPVRWVWVPAAGALTFWVLLGAAARDPQSSHYLYVSALFVLLILLELVRDIRPTPRLALLGVGAVIVSLVPNVINLHSEAREVRKFARAERAELGALDLLRKEVPPTSLPYLTRHHRVIDVGGQGFLIAPGDRILDAGTRGFHIPPVFYFAAVDRYGSPALSPQQLASGSEAQRLSADEVLLENDDLTLTNAGRSSRGRACRSKGLSQPFQVPPSGLEIRPRGSRKGVVVAARRFANDFQELKVPGGSGPMLLRPGSSQEVRPWLVQVDGAKVCATTNAPRPSAR